MESMASACSRNRNRLEPELSRTKRKRRRRSQTVGRSNLEGIENQDCDPIPKCHSSPFYTTFPSPELRSQKKKQPLFYQSQVSHKPSSWAVSPKNAVVQLNELKPDLQYELSERGLMHSPVFHVAVEVNGLQFEGKGPTKKKAKMNVAELALRSFIQFPNVSQAHVAMRQKTWASSDFTQDQIPDEPIQNYESMHVNSNKEVFSSQYNHGLSLDLVSSFSQTTEGFGVSPVALLHRLKPGLKFTCLTESTHCRAIRSFVMVLKLEGRVFEGFGHSKRLAKARAAASALQWLYTVSLGPDPRLVALQGTSSKHQLPQFFAESIFHLVTEKYRELSQNCSSSSPPPPHKVLAGIVLTRGFDLRTAQVVSMATGSKCVAMDSINNYGLTLQDCHAEVLSRRALLRFLYSQLERLLWEPSVSEFQSIFVPFKGSGEGFRLKEEVQFHMFISCSPCGDARLNCPYNSSTKFPSRQLRCGLRLKVDGGEGTLPLTAQRANEQWSGALPRKPLLSISCTDKIAKWSVVGLQGALLSHLVEPIYLHSVTIASLSHTGHMHRAMCRRLATVKHLPFPYRRQPLLLGCLGHSEVGANRKAVNLSLNWTYGDRGLEVISSSSGLKANSKAPSRLCPSAMFMRWQWLHHQISGEEIPTRSYSGSKMAAVRYKRALHQFKSGVHEAGLGSWVREATERRHFQVSS